MRRRTPRPFAPDRLADSPGFVWSGSVPCDRRNTADPSRSLASPTMRKEVTVTHEILACEVCGRTILKGERTEPYLVQDGSRRLVCELCMRRAESAGWIREATHGDMPATPLGAEPRPSLRERFRSLWRSNGARRRSRPGRVEVAMDGQEEPVPVEDARPAPATPRPASAGAGEPEYLEQPEPDPGEEVQADIVDAEQPAVVEEVYPAEETRVADEVSVAEEPGVAPAPAERELEDLSATSEVSVRSERDEPVAQRLRRRVRDPRHVRAVPTNAEVKVERALEVFNYSDYRRVVEGLVRTLGEPWVTAVPVLESTSEVIVVVAWELSWYQYRVDLGDGDDPVMLTHKGKELDELDVTLREWNAVADAEGALALATPRTESAT